MRLRIGHPQPPAKVTRLLSRLITAGLDAADPGIAVGRAVSRSGADLRVGPQRYDLRNYRRVAIVGAGKASARMAVALEQLLGSRVDGGLVVVKYGHALPTRTVEIVEAGHPVPDQAGQKAARRLLDFLAGCGPKDLVFVLLSGGASSLLPAPAAGLTLAETQQTTTLLLQSGATIQEINRVRKHLSAIQGGRLVAATQARIVSLILSDVIGDDLGTIGSGPTAPDPSTFAQACAVLQDYGIWQAVPGAVRSALQAGKRGKREESPKPGSPLFHRVQNHIIGGNAASVAAVAETARTAGLTPLVLTTRLTGEAREAARLFGAMGKELVASGRPIQRPACVIAGGELTVTVRGTGKGGRAQEFALAAAQDIAGLPRLWIAAFGTDGTDGPTDAAGAVADGTTVPRAERQGLDPAESLRDNASYKFFRKMGGHIVTGPTGTNVNDIHLLIAP